MRKQTSGCRKDKKEYPRLKKRKNTNNRPQITPINTVCLFRYCPYVSIRLVQSETRTVESV